MNFVSKVVLGQVSHGFPIHIENYFLACGVKRKLHTKLKTKLIPNTLMCNKENKHVKNLCGDVSGHTIFNTRSI